MPTWLLICLIVLGAILLCLIVFFMEKRKEFLKKIKEKLKIKKPTKKIKEKKKNIKDNKAVPKTDQETKTQDDEEISFTEKEIIINEDGQKLECEPYQPDQSFETTPDYDVVQPSYRRRRSMFDQRRDYNRSQHFVKTREPIKDQIKALSPEMKAILFANVLETKLDEEDKF